MRALVLMLVGGALPLAAVEVPIPQPLDAGRYSGMMEESPFALATVQAAPTAPKESFAANWNLTGLATLPDAQGVSHDFVTIRSRDGRLSFSLYGSEVSTEPEAEGVSLASVEWNLSDTHKSTATLKKGTEFAKVEFGQDTTPSGGAITPPSMPSIPRPGANPPGIVRPQLPGQMPPPGAAAGQVPITGVQPNGIRSPGPIVRPMLPRPGVGGVSNVQPMNAPAINSLNLNGQPRPANNLPMPPPSDATRKIRVINSPR